MKKLLTFLALTGFTAAFSQITITANLPTTINAASSVDAEVKINKGAVGNFAKYQMDVPTGYVVSSIDVKGGNFTFENQRAKIVWVSVPADPEFTIKLKVQANSDAANPGNFTQKFYYLENNEKKEVEATPISVSVNGGSAVASTPVETQPVTTTTPVENKPVQTTPVATTPLETKAETTSTPVETKPVETVVSEPVAENKPAAVEKKAEPTPVTTSSAPASEDGMTFKVQVGAYSTQPNKSKFSNLSNVSIDMVNGMYKVTTGSFKTKEEAIKYRDQIQSKGYSGFIAKYKNGVRIN